MEIEELNKIFKSDIDFLSKEINLKNNFGEFIILTLKIILTFFLKKLRLNFSMKEIKELNQ